MANRPRSFPSLSGEQARQVVSVLVHDGKLAASQVRNALRRHRQLVSDLRVKLAALEEGAGKVGKRLFKDGPFPMSRTVKGMKRKLARRKPRLSAATRKLYQQQGRYLAALRPLSKGARTKVKAIREKSGVRAAIAAAKRMGK